MARARRRMTNWPALFSLLMKHVRILRCLERNEWVGLLMMQAGRRQRTQFGFVLIVMLRKINHINIFFFSMCLFCKEIEVQALNIRTNALPQQFEVGVTCEAIDYERECVPFLGAARIDLKNQIRPYVSFYSLADVERISDKALHSVHRYLCVGTADLGSRKASSHLRRELPSSQGFASRVWAPNIRRSMTKDTLEETPNTVERKALTFNFSCVVIFTE